MATETEPLMNAVLTKPIEEFFLRVVATMKLQACETVTIHFSKGSNLPPITITLAEPKNGEETKPV